MSNKIIFISSHSHSGSTLLDLLLGAHPKMIGLGEVYPLLKSSMDKLKKVECTCGQLAKDCKFWGQAISALKDHENATLPEKYQIVTKTFFKVFGNDTVLVDSSKYMPALNSINLTSEQSIKVIRLIKDVRAFTISHKDILSREIELGMYRLLLNNKKLTEFFLDQTIKSSIYLFLKWYIRNIVATKNIKKTHYPFIKISYENLCFEPERTLKHISKFIEIEFNPAMLVPANHQNHILRGNQMRNAPKKLKSITYDRRWMYRTDWLFPAIIFPFIMKYNTKEVYVKDLIFDIGKPNNSN